MRIMNFLFAVKDRMGDERLLQNLKNKLVAEINRQEFYEVGYFDFVFTKEALVEKMKSNAYDMVLCSEELGGEPVGVGSLRSWKEEFPNIRVILLFGNARKGNPKLIRLIQKLEYTDALYMEDMNGKGICGLLENPRSLIDAVYYYGVEDSEDIRAMGILGNNEEEKKNTTAEKIPVEPAAQEVDENISLPTDDIKGADDAAYSSSTELEDAIREYGDLPMFEEEEEIEEVDSRVEDAKVDIGFCFEDSFPEGGVIEEDEKSGEEKTESEVFDFFAMSSDKEDDVVKYTEIEQVQALEPEFAKVEFEEVDSHESVTESIKEELTQGDATDGNGVAEDIFKMPVTEEIKYGGYMVRTQVEQIISTTGYITKVVDEDSLLVELDTDLVFGDEIQEYRLLIRIKSGRKGVMENGKYRSANVSLEAYVECMVGKKTAMVEVMDFDCQYNSTLLENKECIVILTKM